VRLMQVFTFSEILNSKVNVNCVQRYIKYSIQVYVRLNKIEVKAIVSLTSCVL
jgi:hypothetical protein